MSAVTDAAPPARPFLAEPGENLLATRTPLEAAARLQEFCAATGLPPEQVVCAPSCSVPLPFYAADRPPRFAGIDPAALWHPAFWLPAAVRGRIRIEDDDGGSVLESDERWAARVAVECTVAGLYDETSGLWVDVLASAGVDVATTAGTQRVRAWQDGAPDEALDRIDLSGAMAGRGDPLWSAALVDQLLPPLRLAAWTVTAAALEGLVDELLENLEHADNEPDVVEQTARVAALVAQYAADAFATMPDYAAVAAMWDGLPDRWDGTAADLTGRWLPWMSRELHRLAVTCRAGLEAITGHGQSDGTAVSSDQVS